MSNTSENIRPTLYAIIITAAAGMTAGHVATIERVYDPSAFRADSDPSRPAWPPKRPAPTPLLRSNDRSRWATVRALVDEGTYVIGRRDQERARRDNPYGDYGIVFEDGWETIDKVLPRPGEFYSSKPPFLATIVAGEYWLLKRAFRWSLANEKQRWLIVRVVLLTFNLVPLVIFLWLLARLVEQLGTTEWGRFYVMLAACFGTFLSAFAVVLNNHTVAACCAMFAIYPVIQIWSGNRAAWRFALAGLFAGLTAATELPAAAFALGLFVVLLNCSVRSTLAFFLPALALPVAGFLLTNYLALGQVGLAYSEFGGPWYKYAGSHWEEKRGEVRHGIDWAWEKESRAAYMFHFLFGHHGVFSLSPIWLLAVAGIALALAAKSSRAPPSGQPVPDPAAPPGAAPARDELQMLATLTLILTVVVLGFYLGRRQWNYGGGTAGPRWLLWLTPLWLLTLLPAADRLARWRSGRALALALLLVSVFSAAYPLWTPWRHPWIYNLLDAQGWIPY